LDIIIVAVVAELVVLCFEVINAQVVVLLAVLVFVAVPPM
jgi:hypothetical protein